MTLWPFVLRSTYDRMLKSYQGLLDLKQLAYEQLADNSADSRTHLKEEYDYTISRMADDIRAMDQLIFQMSQCTDWPSMRPHFNKLQAMTEARMREESDRIRNVMLPELKKTYLPKDHPLTDIERKCLNG